MKSFFVRIALMVTLLGWQTHARAAESASAQNARTLVHLLDYIGQDYGGAVKDGKILSEGEYQEMTEFCATAQEVKLDFSSPTIETEIQAQLKGLAGLVSAKSAPEEVALQAKALKVKVLQVAQLSVAPSRWPNLNRGRELFAQNCVACHGPEGKGDGPAGATLNPKPSNFHNEERIGTLSPFQAYNTISLGVKGTGMAGFGQMAEKDIWDLSFYVISLRHAAAGGKQIADSTGLETVASKSDAELLPMLAGSTPEKAARLASLRLHSEDERANSLSIARSNLKSALEAHQAGRSAEARQKALLAYLEGVEPIEPRLKAVSQSALAEVEKRMAAVRSSVETASAAPVMQNAVAEAMATLDKVEVLLQDKAMSPWAVFVMSAAILLREGFEAVLVIVAILGVLKAVKAPQAARWVHGGWLAALALGGVSWIFSSRLTIINGMQRETMEAVVSFLAVVVLLYLGFWLHNKTEIGRWKVFIECRVKAALAGGNLWGLFAISFFAVFREAFETVLFLSALSLEGGPGGRTALGIGVFSALAAVILLAFLLLRYSTRIPIRRLFEFSSILMAALAVVLTGKGLHSLQETGVIGVTSTPFDFSIELLGFYPTMETVVFQVLMALLATFLWMQAKKPSQPQLREVRTGV